MRVEARLLIFGREVRRIVAKQYYEYLKNENYGPPTYDDLPALHRFQVDQPNTVLYQKRRHDNGKDWEKKFTPIVDNNINEEDIRIPSGIPFVNTQLVYVATE